MICKKSKKKSVDLTNNIKQVWYFIGGKIGGKSADLKIIWLVMSVGCLHQKTHLTYFHQLPMI